MHAINSYSKLSSLNVEDWSSLSPALNAIVNRVVSNSDELERLVLDWNALDSYVNETVSEIMVGASLDSNDQKAQARKRNFLERLQPKLEAISNDFAVRVLALITTHKLPERYDLMLRILMSDKEIFRPQNPAINSAVSQLAQKYDTMMGSLTVAVRGVTYTPPAINAPMNTADRTLREELWRGLWGERLLISKDVDALFSEQVKLRHQIAVNAGFNNFRDYSFQKMRRFFYSADDAKRLHESIEKHIVPVSRARYQAHMKQLGVSTLRPWDIGGGRFHELFVKPYAKASPTLASAKEVEQVALRIVREIDADMAAQFEEMRSRKEMDLESRPGKTPGAYQTDFPFRKRPFIFGNNTGVIDDVYTTLHEFGHAYHYLRFCGEPVSTYREIPMEAAELASMGCELIGHNHLELCFSADAAKFIRSDKYERIAFFLCYMAQVDAFQHWVYENPNASEADRHAQWTTLTSRFGPELDWSGLEEFNAIYWHQQLHLFRYPFYYIEYGIAQLGALQVEANYHRDRKGAVEAWRAGLTLGASKPLPEIYETAGIKFDFSEKTIQPVAEMLRKASEGLG